jgi:hypothetical protein
MVGHQGEETVKKVRGPLGPPAGQLFTACGVSMIEVMSLLVVCEVIVLDMTPNG